MKNNVFNILKKEIREMFRDKKSLSMMLVVPILIPFIVLGMSFLFDSQVNKSVEEYNRIGFSYQLSEVEQKLAKEMKIEVVEGSFEDLKKQYEEGSIDLYITKKDSIYQINGYDDETTTYASHLAESYLNAYKEYLQNQYLMNHSILPEEVINIIQIDKNLLVKDNFFASYIVNYAFLFIIMAITVSATYPATDTTAGEKERGTLETLLTFPVSSKDIIIGKFLGVSISSMITGLVSLLLAVLSLKIAGGMFSIYENSPLLLSTSSLLFSILVIVSYSFLISGLCIAIASHSKTFKEAQSALTPITFISFFPGMIAFMLGIENTRILSIIPFLNFTLLFTDIQAGTIDLINIFLMLFSTITIIGIVLYIIIKQYKSEKVLF